MFIDLNSSLYLHGEYCRRGTECLHLFGYRCKGKQELSDCTATNKENFG